MFLEKTNFLYLKTKLNVFINVYEKYSEFLLILKCPLYFYSKEGKVILKSLFASYTSLRVGILCDIFCFLVVASHRGKTA